MLDDLSREYLSPHQITCFDVRGWVLPMARLITKRIKELRCEIAKLTEANRKYLVGPKYGSATADNERRFQRLIEIVDELKSLTDWKKP